MKTLSKKDYIPYPDDECPDLNCNDILINIIHNFEVSVVAIKKNQEAPNYYIRTAFSWESNTDLFKNFTKLDGSPIGKLKGEN